MLYVPFASVVLQVIQLIVRQQARTVVVISSKKQK